MVKIGRQKNRPNTVVSASSVRRRTLAEKVYCDTFLEQSMSYNYENNFVQTLNAAFSVITFLVEN